MEQAESSVVIDDKEASVNDALNQEPEAGDDKVAQAADAAEQKQAVSAASGSSQAPNADAVDASHVSSTSPPTTADANPAQPTSLELSPETASSSVNASGSVMSPLGGAEAYVRPMVRIPGEQNSPRMIQPLRLHESPSPHMRLGATSSFDERSLQKGRTFVPLSPASPATPANIGSASQSPAMRTLSMQVCAAPFACGCLESLISWLLYRLA